MELPYYDSITMTAIDPMHCLFLGVAKHMFKIWKDDETLTEDDIGKIDSKLTKIDGSTRIGSLPKRLSLRTKLTADEWKNWTLFYSLIVLNGILPEANLRNWHTFVKACRIITKPVVSRNQLLIVDALFVKFGKEFTRIYGSNRVTPNMHFACHVTESIQNLGSVYTFWLFAFERYNGFLGKFNSNGRNIEETMMQNMCLESEIYRIGYELRREWRDYNAYFKQWSKATNLALKKATIELYALTSVSMAMCTRHWANLDAIDTWGKTNIVYIDSDDIAFLKSTYSVMYPDQTVHISNLWQFTTEYNYIEIAGELFASQKDKRCNRYSRIMASWFDRSGISADNMSFRPGTIKQLIKHSVMIGGEMKTHILAAVKWNQVYLYDLGYLPPVLQG
jgi:hypothetical protein